MLRILEEVLSRFLHPQLSGFCVAIPHAVLFCALNLSGLGTVHLFGIQ